MAAEVRVATTAELQEALTGAADVIELSPGEYQGAFVIRRPITIRGDNRRTVLWRKSAPVVYVRSAGVVLDALLIERTISAGPAIVHDPNCIPTGKESMELSGDTLISLGELAPGQTLTLPLEIETSSTAEISVVGLYGAQITPSHLEGAGNHTVTLTLDGKSVLKGEALLGEIALKEVRGTRLLWLSGIVMDASLPERDYVLVTKKTRLYPSANGIVIDGNLIAALEGNSPSGKFALIQRDGSGNLYLYAPGISAVPVLLNGSRVTRGTRVLLREVDALTVSKTAFALAPAEPLPFSITPANISFPTFGEQFPDPTTVTLKLGRASWVGSLIATVPWLTVTPTGTLRLAGSRSHEWQVALTADALTLPNGVYDGSLLLNGSEQTLSLDVHLEIKRPEVALSLPEVDAGGVESGWSDSHDIEFQIANFGRGAWKGTVRSTVDWLEVLTEMPVTGESWSATPIQLRVSAPQDKKLKLGKLSVNNALIVRQEDKTEQPIPVTLELLPPQGHLVLPSASLRFDNVERGDPNMPEQSLTIRNDGGAVLSATVEVDAGWVSVEPSEFTLPPGDSLELMVEMVNIPDDQPLNTPILIDELRFSTGESLDVEMVMVELPPYVVTLPLNFPPMVVGDTSPDGTLVIQNLGPALWRGRVTSNVSWLTVPDRDLACEPNDRIEVHVGLNPAVGDTLPIGSNRIEKALSVSGARSDVFVTVQVDLREMVAEVVLETQTLNFGQVNGGSGEALPAELVRLLNPGLLTWRGKIELTVPWLALEADARSLEIEIPKMSVAEFRVSLNEAGRQLPPGIISDDEAIVVAGGDGKSRQRLTVRVLMLVTEWGPVLEVKPARISLTGDSPQTLTIRNLGKRNWPLQVSAAPWLQATPAEVTISPEKETSIEIKRRAEMPLGGKLDDPRALVIIGQGREVEVRVSG
ncbi:MAG: hypothetical protein U0528_04060 [Anaerolineae bacterium]